MKKYFITGLIILLPVTITILIIKMLFNLLTVPFLGIVKAIFAYFHLFENGFLFLNPEQLQGFVAQVLILASLFVLTMGLGLIGRWFFFETFLHVTDYIFKKIPFVNAVYKTCSEVVKTIFSSKEQSFKKVVLVRFPNANSYSVGLVTREGISGLKGTPHEDAVAVFVPTTPNPTSGFLVLFKQADLIYLDMKVEDAFTYVISCGMIQPPFNAVPNEGSQLREEKIALQTPAYQDNQA